MKYLIVGLGNIGAEYDSTRHNIGFDVADAFVIKHGSNFRVERLAAVAECKWKGKQFIVIKPTTYMNLSGKAVKFWMDKEKIAIENILVIMDDIALPLETLRLRPSGTHAGHNGLRNIQEVLGTTAYPRLRFGVGNDFPKGRQVDFVLGKWRPDELPYVKDKILKSIEIIESFATTGMERTMNTYNK
jgi:PTH1 family peptidyl-tRNA hydrolase